ncbi:hypothetical protein EYR38_007918 [Pleurotus pulmonarius]|nr:hypothetical protein EYR38_007918 [Pleurotus pulmonarius]
MEQFSEDHAKLLLDKEWLVKVDNSKSTPYLLKFYSAPDNLSCILLVTDTKSVWSEVLSSKELARRWRINNPITAAPPYDVLKDEQSWRTSCHELLSQAHTLGGIAELSFEVVDSNYSDLAFDLECEAFKWRWETNFVGHKLSAEIISKHLVMPLISVNHLAFASADPVCELPEGDLEKVFRRLIFFLTLLEFVAPISSTAAKPELRAVVNPPTSQPKIRPVSPLLVNESFTTPEIAQSPVRDLPKLDQWVPPSSSLPSAPSQRPVAADSATESDNDDEAPQTTNKGKGRAHDALHTSSQGVKSPSAPNQPSTNVPVSDDDSSPHRPTKKAKPPAPSSSDEDSEAERRRRIAQLKKGTVGTSNRQGARQPIKRGGKRF